MSEHIYTIDELKHIVTPIARSHRLGRVYLFGSYARGDATAASDIDLCIDASALHGLFALGGLYADLEDALQKDLDLLTENSLARNKNKAFVENLRKDQVLLYEPA